MSECTYKIGDCVCGLGPDANPETNCPCIFYTEDDVRPYMDKLSSEIRVININNGWSVLYPDEWKNPYKIPSLLALIHSEVSEALEAFRNNDKENFREEIADILIRTLDLAIGINMNIDREVYAKLEKNRGRGHKHGGKRI